nr:unnamed protein product [Callosobruchus analis]
MELSENLLDVGRVLYTDNFYTSMHLAHELLKRSTHLVGTLRSNRKLNPQDVTKAKLKVSETVARESNTGVVVLKWKNKRDVLMLSTFHDNSMSDVENEYGKVLQKPKMIIDYNNSKGVIDISDQMKAYSSALRRGIKWYRKLAMELITGSALVNAYILYKYVTGRQIQITTFKEEVTMGLLHIDTSDNFTTTDVKCELKNMGSSRRRCTVCYEKLKAEHNRAYATLKAKQTPHKCPQCDVYFCIECFFVKHKSVRI